MGDHSKIKQIKHTKAQLVDENAWGILSLFLFLFLFFLSRLLVFVFKYIFGDFIIFLFRKI